MLHLAFTNARMKLPLEFFDDNTKEKSSVITEKTVLCVYNKNPAGNLCIGTAVIFNKNKSILFNFITIAQ